MIKLRKKILRPLIGAVVIFFLGFSFVSHAYLQGNSPPLGSEPSNIELLKPVIRLLTMIMAIVAVISLHIFLRVLSRFPSELDKIGSDINSYGVGISLYLLVAAINDRPVVPWFGSDQLVLFATVSLLASYLSYLYNLHLSARIRELKVSNRREGIEVHQLLEILENSKGRYLMAESLVVALFPTSALLFALASW